MHPRILLAGSCVALSLFGLAPPALAVGDTQEPLDPSSAGPAPLDVIDGLEKEYDLLRDSTYVSVYVNNVGFRLRPAAATSGGEVASVSAPFVGSYRVERVAGEVDQLKFTLGPFVRASYAEESDNESAVQQQRMVAVAVGSTLWVLLAYDPDSPGDHLLVLGWSTVVSGGQLGVSNADPFAAACVLFACAAA